ncbi:MAG: low molecular weight protein-tyrosine-phosphatase [Phycisphaerales bacterium]
MTTRNDTDARVLFVCMGNICRSPTAEGVFRALLAEADLEGRVYVDSAGTGGWHAGEPPDRRAQAAAKQRGYDLSAQRARQVTLNDFHHFDVVAAMDGENLRHLHAIAPPSTRERVRLLLEFSQQPLDTTEVPDPYYGGVDGFDHVLDLVEAGCRGLLDHVRAMLDTRSSPR